MGFSYIIGEKMTKKEQDNIEKGKIIADTTLRIMQGDRESIENLKSLLSDNSSKHRYLNRMSNSSYLKEASQNFTAHNKEEMSHKLLQRIKRNDQRKRIRRLLVAGSSIAAAFVLLTFIVYNNTHQNNEFAHQNREITPHVKVPTLITDSGGEFLLSESIATDQLDIETKEDNKISYKRPQEISTQWSNHTLLIPAECRYTVVLSDSTEVILNAGSKLKYPSHFFGETRRVELEGEAYFKVRNTGKPFIVSTKEIDIKVYGTEFNVNLNKEASVETILIHGSVGVIIKNSHHNTEIMMTPNQLFSFNTKTDNYNLQTVAYDHYLGWINDSFLSYDQEFSHIIEAISTWYGASFTYDSDETKNMKISANIDMNLTLKQVIAILEKTTEKTIINEGNNNYMIR